MNTTEKLKTLRDLCAESETLADASDAPYQAAKRKTDRVLAPFAAIALAAVLALPMTVSVTAPVDDGFCVPRDGFECMDPFVYNE